MSSDLPFVADMDLAVVISATSPNAGVNFAKIKEIIQEVIAMSGVQRVYYSVILFGRDPTIRIRFNQQFTEDNLRRFIELLPRPSSGVSLDAALQKAKDAFDEGGRSNTKTVKPPYWFGPGFDMAHACLTPSSTVSSMWFVFCFIGPFCIVGLFFGCLSP